VAVERHHGRHPPADGTAQAVPVLARRVGTVDGADAARRQGFDYDDVPYEA